MKKLLTLIFTAIMAVACCFGLTACGKDENTLTIGYTIYPPMNYYEGSDFVGFDTELATEVCKILGKTPKFEEIVWNNKVMDLNSGAIDIVWNGMTITDSLKESMEITSPYLENKQVIVCKVSDAAKYTVPADLANASEVLFETGSAGDDVVSAIDGVNKVGASAQKDTLLAVKTGTNKVAVIDKLMAAAITGEGTDYADLTFVDVGFELEQFGIGVKKGNVELKEQIESAINSLKANGKFDELLRKYFA